MNISISKRRHADEDDAEIGPIKPAIFQILVALADGESHGYGIMQDVERISDGETRLGPGTLYRSLQRMLLEGLIQEIAVAVHDEADDDRRRYYRLTDKGRTLAQREARRLANLVDAARERDLLPKRGARGQARS